LIFKILQTIFARPHPAISDVKSSSRRGCFAYIDDFCGVKTQKMECFMTGYSMRTERA